MTKSILLIEDNEMLARLTQQVLSKTYEVVHKKSAEAAEAYLVHQIPDLIILDLGLPGKGGMDFLKDLKETAPFATVPVMVLSSAETSETRILCFGLGASDFMIKPFHPKELELRIERLFTTPSDQSSTEGKGENLKLKNINFYSFRKRFFDVVLSGTALLFLIPVFFLVAILIRIDSKGSVFFTSNRVGAGYKVFKLLKFRTMRPNADQEIKNMEHLNLYESKAEELSTIGIRSLFSDIGAVSEADYLLKKKRNSAFKKFSNDPRVTPIGAFLRNTSIDELPQLINIFRGDMSIVGNRPLPLYEAEQLTKDEAAERFLAPAGLTGLWQVTKRAKAEMSEKERMDLDNSYARSRNWKMDIKLILKTFPALFQSENV